MATGNKIGHQRMKTLLTALYPSQTVYIEGRTGIGKSQIVRQTCNELAKKTKLPCVQWNKLSQEEKHDLSKKDDAAFILVDLRLSQMDPTDLTGIPFPENGACIYKKQMWVHALNKNPGVLFLDELNLASPSVLSASYQILLDKVVGDVPLHKGVMVVGAGNTQEDKAYTFELPLPVLARVFKYELQLPDVDAWTQWALDRGDIDTRVVSYLNRFKTMIFFEKDDLKLIITPRGWEFVGRAIHKQKDMELVQEMAQGVLGGKAGEFVAFLKLQEKLPKPEDLLKGKAPFPDKVDEQFIACSVLTEHYRDHKTADTLEQIGALHSIKGMNVEFHILLLRMCKAVDAEFFRQCLYKSKDLLELMGKKYQRYMLE